MMSSLRKTKTKKEVKEVIKKKQKIKKNPPIFLLLPPGLSESK